MSLWQSNIFLLSRRNEYNESQLTVKSRIRSVYLYVQSTFSYQGTHMHLSSCQEKILAPTSFLLLLLSWILPDWTSKLPTRSLSFVFLSRPIPFEAYNFVAFLAGLTQNILALISEFYIVLKSLYISLYYVE